MKRFLGMMPSTEIEIEKCYKDKDGYKIIIQAGKNGWTIIYADYSTDFKDIISSANKNFEEAYNLAVNRLGTLTEIIAKEEDKMISCGNCPYLDDCEENDECPFWEDED